MAKIYRRDNLVSGVTPKKKNEKEPEEECDYEFPGDTGGKAAY